MGRERHAGAQWDLIVASDVTYDAELVPLLASTLSSLMRRSHNAGRDPRALLALPQRSHFQPPVIAADGAVLPDAELLFDPSPRAGTRQPQCAPTRDGAERAVSYRHVHGIGVVAFRFLTIIIIN